MAIEIIEPFPEWAWPCVWAWIEPVRDRVSDDYAPQTVEEFVAFSMAMAGRSRTWGISRDGELGGLMVFEPVNEIAGQAHIVCRRDFWGSETTDEAARMALRAVFESGTLKVTGMIFADNALARAMYQRLGFTVEGRLRSQTMRGGIPVDMILCGLTLEDYENGVNSRSRGPARGEEQLAEQPDQHADDGEQLQSGSFEPARPDLPDLKRPAVKPKRRRSAA